MPNEKSSFEEWADYFKDKLPRNATIVLENHLREIGIDNPTFAWKLSFNFVDEGLFSNQGAYYEWTDEGRIFKEHDSYKEYTKDRKIRLKGKAKHWYWNEFSRAVYLILITTFVNWLFTNGPNNTNNEKTYRDTIYLHDTVLIIQPPLKYREDILHK